MATKITLKKPSETGRLRFKATTGSPSAPSAVGVQAIQADSVVDAVGVDIHSGWYDTVYNDYNTVATLLSNLGVRHIREDRSYNDTTQANRIKAMAASSGCLWTMIAGSPTSSQTAAQFVTDLVQLNSVLEGIEGPNEWDINGSSAWVSEVRTRQQALWNAVKANGTLSSKLVLAPSMAFGANAATMGDVSAWCDRGNGHHYTGGRLPSYILATTQSQAAAVAGGKKVWFTETGYNNALSTTESHKPAPESVVGTYSPRVVMENILAGTERAYIYELLDHFPDPEKDEVEKNFGLVHNDYSLKPSYTSLQRLLNLSADPGVAFTPGKLDYSFTGTQADFRQVLAQKRDGSWVLYFWRDVSVYDSTAKTNTAVTSYSVNLVLPVAKSVQLYRPSTAAAAYYNGVTAGGPITMDERIQIATIAA